jgi:hypothetical protein
VELLAIHRARCLDLLRTVLEMEKVQFTQSTHYLEMCTERWLSRYKDARVAKGSGYVQAKDGLPGEAFSLSAPLTLSSLLNQRHKLFSGIEGAWLLWSRGRS